MKTALKTACVTAAGLLLASCGGDSLEEAAAAACECVKPIYSELTSVKQALEAGDDSVVADRNAGLASADQAEACLADVQKTYPGVDEGELEQRLMELIRARQCGSIE